MERTNRSPRADRAHHKLLHQLILERCNNLFPQLQRGMLDHPEQLKKRSIRNNKLYESWRANLLFQTAQQRLVTLLEFAQSEIKRTNGAATGDRLRDNLLNQLIVERCHNLLRQFQRGILNYAE